MEPATIYLTALLAVLGIWLLGDRIWILGTAMAHRWGSGRVSKRFAPAIAACAVALTLVRVSPVGALPMPIHERTIVDNEPVAPDPDMATRLIGHGPIGALRTGATTHTVQAGDCLWRIARHTLETAGTKPSGREISDLWQEIYALNRDVVGENPNLIHPGQVLRLPER